MVKATPFLESLNAGEMSPRMEARVGFEKYPFATSRSLNLISLPQGGASFRPGTRLVKELKSSSNKAALYGAEPTAGRGYMLEFGAGYIRFYANQSRLAAAAATASITNGTFNANIASWTNRSTGTASIAWTATGGGRMNFTGSDDGYAWCEQSVTISDVNNLHIFHFTLYGNLGVTATVQIGTSSTGGELWNKSGYGVGEHTVAVTPGATPIYFQIIEKQNVTLHLDDVEILSNTPLELANTPYSASEVESLRIVQSNDVFYVFHPSYAPRKIERRGDYSWSFTKPLFEDGPWGELNPDMDLAEANLVKNPAFDGGLGEYWIAVQPGTSAIDFDGAQGVVFFRVVGADNPSLYQTITTGASAALHIMHFQVVGMSTLSVRVGTTIGGGEILAATNYIAGWYTISFTPGVSTFYIYFNKGTGHETFLPGLGGVFIFNNRHNLLQASATTGNAVTVTALGDFKPFASTDVDRSIRIEHAGREPGWGIITGFTNSQTVTVKIYRRLASTVATETWRLGSWSATTGYPAMGILYQQRLIGARTADQPQTLWGSQSGDFQNFRPDSWEGGANTTEDDDSFAYTLGAKRGSPIQWLTGTRKLIAGTATGQWVIASRGIALTPADLSAEPHTSIRGAYLEALEIDTVSLFIEYNKQSVDDLGFNYEIDGFKAADLNILADHIAGSSSFEQLVFQSKPYALVWARKADGTFGVLTYKREQNIVGWVPATVAGSSAGAAVVESLAVIPGGAATAVVEPGGVVATAQVYDSFNRDELWMIVKRTIGGATKRYIEVMEGFYRGPNRVDYETNSAWLGAALTAQADAFYVDSGITYSGAPTTSITGLSHLNGESVYVNGDGLAQGPFTVSGGAITLVTAVAKAQVGLASSWRLRGLKANYGAQSGSSVGQQKQIGTMCAVLLDAGTFSYGVETTGEKRRDASFIAMTAHLPSNLALYTGEVVLDKAQADWGDTDPRYLFKGSSPLPWTFLGLMMKVLTNEK